jgi:tetratricopeptide (TPR) repeat protein
LNLVARQSAPGASGDRADLPEADRPYLMLEYDLATLGDYERAFALLDEYEADVPLEDRGGTTPLEWNRTMVSLRAAPDEELIATMRRIVEQERCGICGLAELGDAYAILGQADSAAAFYTRYVETPDMWRVSGDAWELGRVLARLGELHEARGQRQQALSCYARLLDLWKDADPEFQPQLEAVRRRVRELAGDTRE